MHTWSWRTPASCTEGGGQCGDEDATGCAAHDAQP
jgi:hypothetical protein